MRSLRVMARFLGAWRLIGVLAVLTQCTSVTGDPGIDLAQFDRTFWHLFQIDGPAEGGSDVVVRVTKSSLDVSDPCAYASYPFTQGTGGLVFRPPGPRADGCEPGSAIAGVVRDVLPRVRRAVKAGDELRFLGTDGRVLLALAPLVPDGLENREWTIALYFDGETLVSADPYPIGLPRITFMHGHIDGTPGCGLFLGGYRLSDEGLEAQAGWTLNRPCYGDYKKRNNLISRALTGERRLERDGANLRLVDRQKKVQIVLSP